MLINPNEINREGESRLKFAESNPKPQISELEKETQIQKPDSPALRHQSASGHGKSQFNLITCLDYVQHQQKEGRNIQSPEGLARTMHLDGTSDPFIELWVTKKQQSEEKKRLKESIPKREFSEDPCTKCYGIKKERVDDQFTDKPCPWCRDEHNRPTGLEPLELYFQEALSKTNESQLLF